MPASPAGSGPIIRTATVLQRLLGNELMGLLALVSLLTTLASYLFEMMPPLERGILASDLVIVSLFSLEYAAGFVLAPDKRAFLINPWRLVDAFVIVAMVVSLLPGPVAALGASPVLRLIRVVQVAMLGSRSSARLSASLAVTSTRRARPDGPFAAHALRDDPTGMHRFDAVDWEQALAQIDSEGEDWLYLSGVTADRLAPIAQRLKVPERALHNRLFESAFPRLDRLQNFVTLFVWYPQLQTDPTSGAATIERTGLLLVGSAKNVVVLSRGPTDLLDRLQGRLAETEPDTSDLVNATYALVKEITRAYAAMVEHLETQLIRIEVDEPGLRDREFLRRTFRLRGEISRVRTTLRHLATVTRNLHSRRIAIHGFDTAELPQFQLLAGEAADVYERVDELSENLTALVDMRLNVSSFQMNRVMRVLAILTTLALIPAVVGGMLGMNLVSSPWAASLTQVVFWVGTGMLLSLYVFAIRGWLR